MADPLIWLILLPLAWATLAFALSPRFGAWLAIAGLSMQGWLAGELAMKVILGGKAVIHAAGGWGAPLGIDLAADGLSVAFVLLVHAVALPLAIYAHAYFKASDVAGRYFWPLMGFLVAGLNALFLSQDLFNLYVTLELVGLAAVALVAAGGQAPQMAAALRYLFATLLGSGAYMLGVALIYSIYGTVSIAFLTPLVNAGFSPLAAIAAGLMLAGLMLKTALFPLHYWLPSAHAGAPAPVSALLSALVVKASFYLILRLWLGPLQPLLAPLAWLAAALGMAAILWGSWQAIRADKLKRLIACSTVAQLGYLFLIFPLLASGQALHAGLMQVYAHGFAKASMFVAAGVVIKASGHDTVAGLAGAVSRLPVTMFAFGLAGMTLMGLPPSSGFLAKWLLIEAALAQGHWYIAGAVLAGGLLAAVYVFRILRQSFLGAPEGQPLGHVPHSLEWSAFALAAASVLLGLRGSELLHLVSIR